MRRLLSQKLQLAKRSRILLAHNVVLGLVNQLLGLCLISLSVPELLIFIDLLWCLNHRRLSEHLDARRPVSSHGIASCHIHTLIASLVRLILNHFSNLA